MINMILSGANGRMGQAIARIVKETEDIRIVCGVDPYDGLQNDFPVYPEIAACDRTADVIVDFSNPAGLSALLAYAVKRRIPCVIATTGLSAEQKQEMENAAAEIPVFFSANMSLGVNLLAELAAQAARLLAENFDIEIIEKHHNQKLDAPSGTALAIADEISGQLPYPAQYVYDRHCVRKKRDRNEIGIHSIRGGTIVGEHSVIFAGTDEVIELSHSAASREVFAVGAVRAAKYLAGKPAGIYHMKDLMKEYLQF